MSPMELKLDGCSNEVAAFQRVHSTSTACPIYIVSCYSLQPGMQTVAPGEKTRLESDVDLETTA